MLKAYADEHVRWAIVQALRQRSMDVVTVQERQGEGANDADVLVEATRDGRILLTNDTDFLVLASQYIRRGERFAPIFYWPQQSRRRVGDIVRRIIREAARNDFATICSQVHFL